MQAPSQRHVRNRLLAALPPPDYEALRAALEPVSLARGDVVVEPDRPLTHALFVEAGIVSAVSRAEERRIEIGLTGREGFVGVPLALGVDRTPHESIVQVEGEALRVRVQAFSGLLERHPAIRACCCATRTSSSCRPRRRPCRTAATISRSGWRAGS